MGKVIHRELCKKSKFDHTNKCYMHNLKSILKNEMHKILWNFVIQTDHLISARWLVLVMINKKKENLPNSELCQQTTEWNLKKAKR